MEYALFLVILLYLLPWMLAEAVEHPRRAWILALTLGLGWTGLVWVLGLAWVWRDWPRPSRRPVLRLVDPGVVPAPSPRSARWRRWRRRLVLGGGGLALATLLGWLVLRPPERMPVSGVAWLSRDGVAIRMGPDERWHRLGELGRPCRLGLLEREGRWRRVSRLGECAGSMRGRLGWVPVDALRRVVQPGGSARLRSGRAGSLGAQLSRTRQVE